ncbi:efflux RND transporter periplasmic adaptor subunit [Metapseudomonas resinovorans]|uniref:Pyoverdine efflux pump membrane fusion protein PvdR n=1 Tax=Metapseudomonas resinovorans NBRC 106553 TaxID=1245471 RepID=S6AI83_METRE|nr:efflux RND transporter periplasmic adaptor subunit [Pseudomonas resinovorans]BAN48025.1 pyoverdine efflux pump membrane fusion protein PvdR [Pseudomonas resinovorans NBRC 106553]
MRSSRTKAWALTLLPLAALSLAGWQAFAPGEAQPTTVAAARADLESSVTALGTLQPRRYVDVGAQASGQVLRLHAEVGDEVKEGQLLLEIDPSTQRAKVDAGHAQIDSLKAQLEEQHAQHDLARQQHQRQTLLANSGATRDEDLQAAQAQLRATQAKLKMLKAQIRQAEATLRSDEAELGYTRIYAPISGTVVALDARVGQTLNALEQTPLVMRIARLSPMTVWAQVSEADIGRVKPGMTAYFTTLGGEGRRWQGKVRQILPVPPRPLEQMNQGGGSPVSGTGQGAGSGRVVLYSVLLDVDNDDHTLLPEMTAQVFFVAASAKDTLSVPLAALQPIDGKPGTYQARVLDEDGNAQAREVRTGVRDRLRIQVLSGLEEGERLLVGPVADES